MVKLVYKYQNLLHILFIHECTKTLQDRQVYKEELMGLKLKFGTPTPLLIDQIKLAIDQ